jgi:UDP-N-acetylmuramate dehydrogenase
MSIKNIIQENVSLKDKNTFKIDGIARFYAEVDNKNDFLSIIKKAKEQSLPIFVLGGGSNTLVSDFNGLIIKYIASDISDDFKVDAGAQLSKALVKSIELSMGGLEWAMGIPGTIGGAIYGNAGVKDNSIGDIIEYVEIFNGENIEKINKDKCSFSYRHSIFKEKSNWIILSCKLNLERSRGVKERANEFFQKRSKINGNSLGSVFRNPEGEKTAGELIDSCGLKGKRIGGVIVSEEHANWIINDQNGTSEDVKELINLIKKEVRNKFDIDLKEEIQYLGK